MHGDMHGGESGWLLSVSVDEHHHRQPVHDVQGVPQCGRIVQGRSAECYHVAQGCDFDEALRATVHYQLFKSPSNCLTQVHLRVDGSR